MKNLALVTVLLGLLAVGVAGGAGVSLGSSSASSAADPDQVCAHAEVDPQPLTLNGAFIANVPSAAVVDDECVPVPTTTVTTTLPAVTTTLPAVTTTLPAVTTTVTVPGPTTTVTTTVPAPSPQTFGETTILPGADNGNANLLVAQAATLTQGGTLQSLSFYVTTAAGNLRLGIYDASGPGGGPGALLASTASFAPASGWNTVLTTSSL